MDLVENEATKEMNDKKAQTREIKKLLIAIVIIASLSVMAYSISVQFSDQGSNARYGGNVIQNGNLTIEVWNSQTSNDSSNLVYSRTFEGVINDGGWNIIVGQEGDLQLDYGVQYWKKYKINGQELQFSSNGTTVDRLPFQSSLGLVNYSYIKEVPIGLQQITNLTCAEGEVIAWNQANNSWECRNTITQINTKPELGNISSSRIVKDTGTNWLGQLLDFILESIHDMIIGVNQTTIHTTGDETKQGNFEVNGTMTATQFVGDGSLITGVTKEQSPLTNTTAQIMIRPGYPMYVNISETLYVDGNNGKVGINQPNPAEALDVGGNISLSGDLKINDSHSVTFGSQGKIYVEGETLIIEN